MPELPEVETVAQDLRAAVVGRRIESIELSRADVLRMPPADVFAKVVAGQSVISVDRRGKFILLGMDGGDELMVHLGMTGHLLVCDGDSSPARHTHMRARLDDGRELRFDDTRRFGRVAYGSRALLEESRVLPPLGIEPLSDEFTAAELRRILHRSTRTVKAALLDQARVAGLGNIYIDEACFAAGVRPTRRCHRLTRAQIEALHEAIQRTLRRAIVNRGSSVDDYRDVWNAQGNHQEALQVYGRGGQPCFRCGTMLRRAVVGGRTTVHCPHCQH
ncbi:MAG: bifunctional DNA-formamidopyrimidine glycosylase/DNA-(apurinic or apyrimidinic site) lyase [Candidatus Dormibacteraeota bacterium]|nr:bifunctional DNA-formamidopyrimidine glycosylase/DNA-(apurinic or apyrimidinic site) lyase [Candidatus Dormibacteraeota bacterium]